MQWTANVFHHLFRLPIEWFEKRDIGNISAKFGAINVIQNTLTTSVIQALLDLVLVVGTLTVMLLYSPAAFRNCNHSCTCLCDLTFCMVWYI